MNGLLFVIHYVPYRAWKMFW